MGRKERQPASPQWVYIGFALIFVAILAVYAVKTHYTWPDSVTRRVVSDLIYLVAVWMMWTYLSAARLILRQARHPKAEVAVDSIFALAVVARIVYVISTYLP